MKNLTRSDLEAIGQNWLYRRNKLLDYARKPETQDEKSFRAWELSYILTQRITKIAIALGQPQQPKRFQPGGVVSSLESMQPGERVIAKPNFKSMRDYETKTPTEPVEIVTEPTKSLALYIQQIGRKKRPLKDYQPQIINNLCENGGPKIVVPK